MNCKNCGYGLKQRCGDFEKIICTYEEGECVKITELEKEIAEMKEQNTNLQEMLKTERSVTCKEEYLKKVTELEQENAELKDDNKVMADNYSKMEQKFYDNLTKAKEIIKILLKYDRGQFFDDRRIYEQYIHTRGEAEQFIKDSEVEK